MSHSHFMMLLHFYSIRVLAVVAGLYALVCLYKLHANRTVVVATPFLPDADRKVLDSVLNCGSVCQYDKPSTWSPHPAQCTLAWLRMLSTCPSTSWPPPSQPPAELVDAYTMGGRIAQSEWMFEQRYSGQDALKSVWDPVALEKAVMAEDIVEVTKHVETTYSEWITPYVEGILSEFSGALSGRVGVVWGSEKPWAEVLLARSGARHITTVEYGRITSTHPRFTTITPSKLAAFMITNPRTWDFAFTYSSLEHSGLGRYGDALNPWGDMEAAVQTWCLLKPGGFFFLGLPCKDDACSIDELVWNAHRFYGPLRLKEVLAGYKHVKTIPPTHPDVTFAAVIHVLQKPSS
jgi:hypothetical protein